jgi:hypothetical protein
MAAELNPIDISNNPLLRTLVDEARAANTERSVVVDNQVVATLVPLAVEQPASERGRRTRQAPGKSAGRTDTSLLRLVGIATAPEDDGIHDAARHHDKYLADAYADRHQ